MRKLLVSFFIHGVLVLLVAVTTGRCEPVPALPLQFSAKIKITAHQISPESEYPPQIRRMSIVYDYIGLKARAEIEAGYEAAKIYIRRYDKDQEYMLRLPPINDCKRSYLGEVMPFPDIPSSRFVSQEVINGVTCNYFLHEDFETRVHIYLNTKTGAPVRLLTESVEDNVSVPLLTYDYSDVVLGPPPEAWFDIPSPYTHDTCDRHIGGFPYLHVFHYFIKF